MRDSAFLRMMVREGEVKKVKPSENLAASYLAKAQEFAEASEILLESGKLEAVVTNAYYSMYYSSLALLFRLGYKSTNHSATVFLLRLFGHDSQSLESAKRERIDKQYFITSDMGTDEVRELVESMRTFNAEIYDTAARVGEGEFARSEAVFERMLAGDR